MVALMFQARRFDKAATRRSSTKANGSTTTTTMILIGMLWLVVAVHVVDVTHGFVPTSSSSFSSSRQPLSHVQSAAASAAAAAAIHSVAYPRSNSLLASLEMASPSSSSSASHQPSSSPPNNNKNQQQNRKSKSNNSSNNNKKSKSKSKFITLGEMSQKMLENPALYQLDASQLANNGKKKKKSMTINTKAKKRTRRRVEQPQQTYLYAPQRRKLLAQTQPQQQQQQRQHVNGDENNNENDANRDDEGYYHVDITATKKSNNNNNNPSTDEVALAARQGWSGAWLASRYCQILPGEAPPKLIKRLRLMNGAAAAAAAENDDEDDDIDETTPPSSSSSADDVDDTWAYIIDKPPGWTIVGSRPNKKKKKNNGTKQQFTTSNGNTNNNNEDGVEAVMPEIDLDRMDDDGLMKAFDALDDNALLAMIEEQQPSSSTTNEAQDFQPYDDDLEDEDDELLATNDNEETSPLLSNMEKKLSGTTSPTLSSPSSSDKARISGSSTTEANLRRIEARQQRQDKHNDARAHFASADMTRRPSIVSWLQQQQEQNNDNNHNQTAEARIRGGTYWTAVAGATSVDDSGLVLLCPKHAVDRVVVDSVSCVALVGNGDYYDQEDDDYEDREDATLPQHEASISENSIDVKTLSKWNKGRGQDAISLVRVTSNLPEVDLGGRRPGITCDDAAKACQRQYGQAVRGDPAANLWDTRAQRRLVHCESMEVSPLADWESVKSSSHDLPDDMHMLAARSQGQGRIFDEHGSFLGRAHLRDNPKTNAYREINGAADGFPGWTVDRYDAWLLVQHDPRMAMGPLPSIHAGHTNGIYYVETTPKGGTGKPRLWQGQRAPDLFPILENGIGYMVSLEQDASSSTGVFLDQRPQRAWLQRHCTEQTHILNCFAHTGAFSVAAAMAGAWTVSLDLSPRWLQRLPAHFEVNHLAFDERHDSIYGDCFEWLPRLAQRGEKYDVVILDPPSTSVGGRKKKRWSVTHDLDELVALAAVLVKPGGFLWTSTNCAALPVHKFARLCRRGLEDAGIEKARLERIQPMPYDFPSLGAQPVKNLVWKIP